MSNKTQRIQGFIVYRIFYGERLVYIGRTKQPLQNRIRGHLFSKPMHRTIAIEMVTKIEYTEFQTEADMNLYEIYFILKWHPLLNVDDKTRDYPTVDLPDVCWKEFHTPLWGKWMQQITETVNDHQKALRRYHQIPEEISVIRSARHTEELSSEEAILKIEQLKTESQDLHCMLWG